MKPSSRVFFIAYHFPPAAGPGVHRSQKFVQYLPEFGWTPIVMTAPIGETGRFGQQDDELLNSIGAEVEIHRVLGVVPGDGGNLASRARRWLNLPTRFGQW